MQDNELVQLHTRVRSSTKEAIQRIAKQRRCQIGAVIDEAIRLYEKHTRGAKP
jgi:hypothetical protein